MKFNSDYILVHCPDGPRYILKKPEKAFAIEAPEWNIRLKPILKFLGKAEADSDTEIKKEIKSLVTDLTEEYAAIQAHYKAAYVGWCTNPCNKEAEKNFQKALEDIREKDFSLREIEVKTEKLSKQLEIRSKIIEHLPEPRTMYRRIPSEQTGQQRISAGKSPLRMRRATALRERQIPILIESYIPIEASLKELEEAVSRLKININK